MCTHVLGLCVHRKRQNHLVTTATLIPDSSVSSQCSVDYFLARLCVSNGMHPSLCQWSEPLRSMQF